MPARFTGSVHDTPQTRHGLIALLVARRVQAERKRRQMAARAVEQGHPEKAPRKPKHRWWF